MGKHSAAADATVHPLVAEALARRAGAPGAAHDADAPGRGGSTGWPEPPPSGGGSPVGWPDEARPDRAGEEQQSGNGRDDDLGAVAVGTPARRGWRRLFGAPAA